MPWLGQRLLTGAVQQREEREQRDLSKEWGHSAVHADFLTS